MEAREGTGFSGAGIIQVVESPDMDARDKQNLGPQQKQQALLTAEQFLLHPQPVCAHEHECHGMYVETG